ncbi:Protein of unknown function [Gryllus bimaculatus]|nr:Protein of unknown function [Gryllus bimaculatus]
MRRLNRSRGFLGSGSGTCEGKLRRLLPDLNTPTRRLMTCSARQAQCLTQGHLPYYDGRCFDPLERGPCPAGEWFTLELAGAGAGALEGRCVPRPCPEGLLPADGGLCLREEEARERVCGGGPVHLDPAGRPRCGARRGWPPFLSAYVTCVQHDARRDGSNE